MRLVLTTLALAALSLAEYQEFFFTANGTCPGLAWGCVADGVLAACAYDSTVDTNYCCGGAAQGTCRVSAPHCLGSDGGPSSTQQLCSVGETNWCCLKDTEACTPKQGQINVCIATQPDTIANVSQEVLNETFSSLSSAAPTATTFSFDAVALAASAAVSTSSSSTVTSSQLPATSSSSSSTSSPSPTPSSSTSSSSSLSGGAIAGIVVGCVIGIAAVLIIAFLIFRRRRNGNNSRGPANETGYTSVPTQSMEKKEMEGDGRFELFSQKPAAEELESMHEPRELPGGRGVASELPAH